MGSKRKSFVHDDMAMMLTWMMVEWTLGGEKWSALRSDLWGLLTAQTADQNPAGLPLLTDSTHRTPLSPSLLPAWFIKLKCFLIIHPQTLTLLCTVCIQHCKTEAVQVAIKWNSGSSVQVWYSATATRQMDSATDQDELKMKQRPEKIWTRRCAKVGLAWFFVGTTSSVFTL